MNINTVTCAVIGYGNRGEAYTKYALSHPNEFKVLAVVEPNEFRRNLARDTFSIDKGLCFEKIDDFLDKHITVDLIINATMDKLHYETTMPLLEANYNVLLEKPITSNPVELINLQKTALKNNCQLKICHVLRYTPFYAEIKQHILDGVVGEIMHIETNEDVCVAHSSCAYVRGKWKNKSECGSSMLLAKCCHDLDLLSWLNNSTIPQEVFSFGGRNFITPDKAPAGAGTRCLVDCHHVNTCMWSAKKISIDNNYFPEYVWASLDKNFDEITLEEKMNSLKTDNPFGICAYKTNADIVDHQTVIIHFENGSTAHHSMIAGTVRPGRKIHIIGTEGEIEGFFEDSTYCIRKFSEDNAWFKEENFKIEADLSAGHLGGDDRIIIDFIRSIRGEKTSISSTSIDDSINGHLCVYAADKSMETMESVILSW